MPYAIAAAAIGAGTSIYAGSKQASAAKSAANAQLSAAQDTNALDKYIFDQTRADYAPGRDVGNSALYRISDLLGLERSGGGQQNALTSGGQPQSNPDAQTMAQIRERLTAWDQALPGNARPIIQAIDGGASLGQVQSMLQSLRATTTNPQNTAFLDPALQLAGNAAKGYTVQQPGNALSGGAAIDNSPDGIKARQDSAFSTFRTDPGYQWSVDQGSKALQNSAAARGVLNSGQTAKALDTFGQGLGDQQFGSWFNRLQSAANLGQSATQGTAQAGQAYATNQGNAFRAAGNARASAYTGAGNAWAGAANGVNDAFGNGLNNYAYMNAFNSGGGGSSFNSHSGGWDSAQLASAPWM